MSARGISLPIAGYEGQVAAANGVQLAVTAATANVQLPVADGDSLFIFNSGTNVAYVMIGVGTGNAVATLSNGFPVLPGHGFQMDMPPPNRKLPSEGQAAYFLAAICAATQTAQISAFIASGNFNCQ